MIMITHREYNTSLVTIYIIGYVDMYYTRFKYCLSLIQFRMFKNFV